jgi:hypothetical protein
MEDNKELVTEVTENVEEQATEELVDGSSANEVVTEEKKGKYYTDEEFDKIIQTRLGRQERTIRKEYDKKYGRLENVLKAGLEDDNLDSITDQLSDFYTKQGKQIPSTPQFSQRDMEYLAERDANEIIESGYDEVVNELNRLSEVGADNMTQSDKVIFLKLKEEADRVTNEKELKSIGVSELPNDFKDFAKKLNPELSLKEKYEMYSKLNPKKKGEPMGSMKNTDVSNKGVKEYYSFEESKKFTRKDYDENPELFAAVKRSMANWK